MIQLGKLKPEVLQEKIESYKNFYTHEQLIERYIQVQDELTYEKAVGEWLDALANAYREGDNEQWDEVQVAQDRLNEIKNIIKAKYE